MKVIYELKHALLLGNATASEADAVYTRCVDLGVLENERKILCQFCFSDRVGKAELRTLMERSPSFVSRPRSLLRDMETKKITWSSFLNRYVLCPREFV